MSPNSFRPTRVRALARGATLFLVALLVSTGLRAADGTKPAPPRLAPSAIAQMQAIRSIKTGKTPIQNKIDSRLYLALLHQRNDARVSSLTNFRFVKPEADGRVAVDIVLNSVAGLKPVVNLVEVQGGVVLAKSSTYLTLRARVRLDDLEALVAIPGVRRVRTAMPSRTSVVNVSEGDKTHGADEARGFFGVNGNGIKVGVLSNGVDTLAAVQATGDLPPTVQVLPGQAGSGNEGTAMLEIVHDLAPGAALAFATVDPDEATFAANILALAAAGCNVIVDDVIYLDESPFEDSPIAQAVNTVTAAGVIYFSSAGNEGNTFNVSSGTWEGDFKASAAADPGPLAGANLHDFGDGGNSILVTASGGLPVLIWAEHYDLNTGDASTDFDLYDMDGALTTIFDASTETQDGTGGDDFPVEFIGSGAFAGERLLIDKFASGTTSSVPMFNLIDFRGELDPDLATSGATRGHSSCADAFSVAATPAAASHDGITPDGPYPGLFTAANATEWFSSDGPRRIILDTDGNEITAGNRTSTGGVVRQKPDITAADGVSCAAAGFAHFYGTSAAAPHAAALAALLKSALPGITPAQVRTALVSSAIDIQTVGVDRNTGAGIVMAHAALQAAGAEPGAFLEAGTAVPSPVVGDGDAYIESNEVWDLSIPLTNLGATSSATAIHAVLSTSTPGVSVTAAYSSYPDLAPSGSGSNSSPFTFALGDDFACGTVIKFTLAVTYTGGAGLQSFDVSIPTGAPGTPVTFSYTGPAVPIPDAGDLSGNNPGAPVLVNLPVSSVGSGVFKVVVSIDGTSCSNTAGSTTVGLDHTFVNDLRITLHSPSGTAITVISNTDGSGNNFCQTVLDDAGATNIQSVVTANAPFTGTFAPNSPLAAFSGEPADGTWQLEAQDFFLGDTGSVRAFSITITPAVCDVASLSAQGMAVDAHAATGDNSNHNGVFELGETAQVSPFWKNTSASVPQTFLGTASLLGGPGGPTYNIDDGKADYGTITAGTSQDCYAATADCYLMTITGTRPIQHWDATFSEALDAGLTKTWKLHVGGSFDDVPAANPFYAFIENLLHNGVTSGCSLTSYCPDNSAPREQMAVFLLRSKFGPAYMPPPAAGIFADVPTSSPYAAWIEDLYNRGITSGCSTSPLQYCPGLAVTREQAAVLMLLTLNGSSYTPPPATGLFGDVPMADPFAPFIEQLYNQGITAGCSASPLLYCPNDINTRGQMAVFLVETFGLALYGP